MQTIRKTKELFGSGEIRTRASEETGALNQRLRPLGHATLHINNTLRILLKVTRCIIMKVGKMPKSLNDPVFDLVFKSVV